MSAIGTTILESILVLLLSVCFFYLLAKLGQEKGLGHAIRGFLLPVYPYVWGWMQGRRLERLDIKGFWTVITVFSMRSPGRDDRSHGLCVLSALEKAGRQRRGAQPRPHSASRPRPKGLAHQRRPSRVVSRSPALRTQFIPDGKAGLGAPVHCLQPNEGEHAQRVDVVRLDPILAHQPAVRLGVQVRQ